MGAKARVMTAVDIQGVGERYDTRKSIEYMQQGEIVLFAGGSGAVISMKPIGFLTSNDTGVKLISTDKDVYTRLFDTVEEFIEKIKK